MAQEIEWSDRLASQGVQPLLHLHRDGLVSRCSPERDAECREALKEAVNYDEAQGVGEWKCKICPQSGTLSIETRFGNDLIRLKDFPMTEWMIDLHMKHM